MHNFEYTVGYVNTSINIFVAFNTFGLLFRGLRPEFLKVTQCLIHSIKYRQTALWKRLIAPLCRLQHLQLASTCTTLSALLTVYQ